MGAQAAVRHPVGDRKEVDGRCWRQKRLGDSRAHSLEHFDGHAGHCSGLAGLALLLVVHVWRSGKALRPPQARERQISPRSIDDIMRSPRRKIRGGTTFRKHDLGVGFRERR